MHERNKQKNHGIETKYRFGFAYILRRDTLPNPCTDGSILKITLSGYVFPASMFFCRFLRGLRRFEGVLQSSKVGGVYFEFFCLCSFGNKFVIRAG